MGSLKHLKVNGWVWWGVQLQFPPKLWPSAPFITLNTLLLSTAPPLVKTPGPGLLRFYSDFLFSTLNRAAVTTTGLFQRRRGTLFWEIEEFPLDHRTALKLLSRQNWLFFALLFIILFMTYFSHSGGRHIMVILWPSVLWWSRCLIMRKLHSRTFWSLSQRGGYEAVSLQLLWMDFNYKK